MAYKYTEEEKQILKGRPNFSFSADLMKRVLKMENNPRMFLKAMLDIADFMDSPGADIQNFGMASTLLTEEDIRFIEENNIKYITKERKKEENGR